MRRAEIRMGDKVAGWLLENENGYEFAYDENYLADPKSDPVSMTLPLTATPFVSKTMFSFFDGLIPEGWLLEIAEENFKIDPRDRMGLLLVCCKDCIGAVSVYPVKDLANDE